MMKALKNSSEAACRLSWLLVEIGEGQAAAYHAIHSVEVLGDCNEAYVSRKVRFSLERTQCTGIIQLASDDLKIIEKERDRLLALKETLSNQIQPLKPDLWCLVRQTTDHNKIRLIIVSCKTLTFVESPDLNRKHFLMQKDQAQLPITLLHILDSKQQLLDEMTFLNDTFVRHFVCEEKDRLVELGGLDKAFFLIQYFEDNSNLIFSIVRYRDTIWKDKNLFPNVVAYITDGKAVSQCIVLRKSYEKAELTALLLQIKETCDKMDYPVLHSRLKISNVQTNGDQGR